VVSNGWSDAVVLWQQVLWRLHDDERGIAALEYTLITVIIGAVVLSGVHYIGNTLEDSYGAIGNVLMSLAAGS
jgi:Flp pilus assembly pilin Flp